MNAKSHRNIMLLPLVRAGANCIYKLLGIKHAVLYSSYPS